MLGQLSSPDLGQLWSQLEDVSYRVSEFYETTAPAVSEWAEFLFARKAEQITWAEIMFIVDLDITKLHPNFAQNALFKLKYRLGQSTEGLIDH